MQFKLGLLLLPMYGMLSLAQQRNSSLPYSFLLSLEQGEDTYFLQVAPQSAPTSPSRHLFHVAKTGIDAPPSPFTLDEGVLRFEDREARRLADDDEGSNPKKLLPFLNQTELGYEKFTTFESVIVAGGANLLRPTEVDGALGFVFEDNELFISVSDNDEHIDLKVEPFE